MHFSYDLTQAEPIVRDVVVGGTSDILYGAVVARDGAITTALNRFCVQNATATVIDDVVGVANEFYDYSVHLSSTGANAATAAATGVSNYIKIIINPMAIWMAEYSQHADDDTVNTSADSTGKVITATFTTDREGDWCYITDVGSTTGGAGNLFMIGASTSTTSVTACTTYDDWLKGSNTSDTFIVISRPFQPLVAGGSLDLSAAADPWTGTSIKGVPASGTGAILVLENYIQDKATPIEPLRVERHSGHNFHAGTVRLFADIQLMDHLMLGGGVATAPQIT